MTQIEGCTPSSLPFFLARPLAFAVSLLLPLAFGMALSAQQPGTGAGGDGGDGWLPWVGCWQAVGDAASEPGSILCVTPLEEGEAVRLRTSDQADAPGADAFEAEILRLDGVERTSDVDGCEGWSRGELSPDGRRVYLRSEHLCAGGIERISTGVLALVSPYEWLDVRTVAVEGDARTWTRRYRLADPAAVEEAGMAAWATSETMATQAARAHASAPLDVDGVIDAADHVHPDGLRAWVAELNDPFDLTGDDLVRLADAGVPGDVTDVMVAVSFPDRFALERNGEVEVAQQPAVGGARRPVTRSGGYPMFGTGFGWSRWDRRYYYDPFYYPWGYSGFGWGSYGYRPSVIYVTPRSPAPEGGRVVNDRGYTRSGSSTRPARPRSSSSGSSSTTSSGRSPSPSSTPSASSGGSRGSSGGSVSNRGGYRGGSSSGDDTRRARPRSDGDGGD